MKKILAGNSFNELHWIKDGSLLYASGKEDSTKKVCLYKSEDEGRTWNIVASFPSYNITEILAHGDTLFVKIDSDYYYRNSTLWISIDNGRSWILCTTPYTKNGGYFDVSLF